MKQAYRKWRWLAFGLLLLVCLSPLWLAIWTGVDLARPDRRELMPYHREFLANQAAHAVRIDSLTTKDGTPCMLVSPDGPVLGERGKTIRAQLEHRGLSLPPIGEIIGTIELIHGRNGRKEDYLTIAERFCAVGFRCLLPDMPAHGDNRKPIATYGCNEAPIPYRCLQEASTRFSFPMEPAALLGMSMGGSIAVHAADHQPSRWNALVVISSFDSFPAVAKHHSERMSVAGLGPASLSVSRLVYQLLSGTDFEQIKPSLHAQNITIPTLVIHGDDDKTVPIESGRRLYQNLPNTTVKQWLEVPDAGHNNILVTDYPVYAAIAEWMLIHLVEP